MIRPPNLADVRQRLQKAGYEPVVQTYGTSRDIVVRLGLPKSAKSGELSDQARDTMKSQVLAQLPGAKLEQVEYVGAQVSGSLLTNGILAVIVSLIAVMIYIAMRFEYRFAISAAIAFDS